MHARQSQRLPDIARMHACIARHPDQSLEHTSTLLCHRRGNSMRNKYVCTERLQTTYSDAAMWNRALYVIERHQCRGVKQGPQSVDTPLLIFTMRRG